jgi:hypothetical protein
MYDGTQTTIFRYTFLCAVLRLRAHMLLHVLNAANMPSFAETLPSILVSRMFTVSLV